MLRYLSSLTREKIETTKLSGVFGKLIVFLYSERPL